jgi:hypothetical protein
MTDPTDKNRQMHLGEPIGTFAPTKSNIFAGYILSLILLVAGAAGVCLPLQAAYRLQWNMPLKADHGWSWITVTIIVIFGVGFLIGGVNLLSHCKRLRLFRVDFFTLGFRRYTRHNAENVLWADVACVRRVKLFEKLPLLKGPGRALMPTIQSDYYSVVLKSGKAVTFTGNDIHPIQRFGQLLANQAKAKSIPWEDLEEHA